MITQTEQLARLKAYLTERLEEWDGVERLGVAWKASKDGYSVWGSKFNICYGCDDDAAICIASSRTLAPILLANTLREIEFLQNWSTTMETVGFAEHIAKKISDRLNEILTAFKEVLG